MTFYKISTPYLISSIITIVDIQKYTYSVLANAFWIAAQQKEVVSVSRIWSHSTFNHVWTITEVSWCFQGRQRGTVDVNGLDHIFHYISENFWLPIYLADSYKDHHSAWNYQCVTSKRKSWWRWSANRLQVYDPMFERHTPYILSCVQQIWNGMQSRIKNPVKHLKSINYFCKTLYLRCLTTF